MSFGGVDRARSAEQGVPSDEDILESAEKFLSWLEQV